MDKVDKNNNVLVYHGLGSGKTLTALAAGEKYPGPVSVIGPAALRGNFKKEKQKFNADTDVDYSSYAKPEPSKNRGTLVFDEAHRMGRMESQRSKYPDQYEADKKVFLTGSPLRNRPEELIPLMRGLDIDFPRSSSKFKDKYIDRKTVNPGLFARLIKGVKPGKYERGKNLEELENLLKGKVDYHKTDASQGFPDRKEKEIEVPMSEMQQEAYAMAAKENPKLSYKVKYGIPPSKSESGRMNAFLNATRQISNTPREYSQVDTSSEEPKLDKVVEKIKEGIENDPNYKGVTYSNYLSSGIDRIAERLEEEGIPYATFTGRTSDEERKEIIDKYNKGQIKQLLVSGAGSEGLNLKGTKKVQVVEPHWNKSRIDQVIGRASRLDSHSHLPEDEQEITIEKFKSVFPEPGKLRKWLGAKRKKATDEYLYELSEQKERLNKDFLEMLRRASEKFENKNKE